MPRELALFCDRTQERTAIDRFLSNLHQGNGHNYPSVLSYYGVGGVGKTRLYQKSVIDFRERMEQDMYNLMPPKMAEVDLDSDSVRLDSPIAQILGRVRMALHREGIKTPAFDYLYLAWWNEENPGQSIDLSRSTGSEKIGVFLDVVELASGLASLFGMELPKIGVAPSLHKLYSHMHDWFVHSRVRQRFDGMPENWSQAERIERMPILLASDLLDAIAHQPQTSICLIIDGFERVQSRELLPDAQRALARLVSEVLRCKEIIPLSENKLLRARIGFIILGREKLRWPELYANERVSQNWQQEIDAHAQLLGLTEEDARSFLIDLAAPWEREHGRENVAQLIERHTAQILEAALENSKESNQSFLPYYLDLAVMLIRDNAHDFEPNMLGKSPSDLALRFLRYLKGEHREALQALALALEFDRETFAYLIERGYIRGYLVAHFAGLVGDNWSFATPVGNRPGFHSFHRHMQDSLAASMVMREERERAAEIVEALLERQFERARFRVPADFGLMQESAYSDATNMLFFHHSKRLLETATAVRWMLRFQSLFDSRHAMVLRRRGLEWAVEVSRRDLGDEHPDTLICIGQFALTLWAQGNLPVARVLQENVLKVRQRVLGEDHAQTLTAMNNLALTLAAQGDYAAARVLEEKVLEIRRQVLGEEHPDTLTSMNNLAWTLRAQGDLPAALTLEETVLEINREVLGEEHPDTLTSMNNLALTLYEQGDLSAARALQEKVFEMQRWILGEGHPDMLTSMGNLASTLWAQGDYLAARALAEKALEIRRGVLGEEHPDTLTSMGNLAVILEAQGDLSAARTLEKTVLEIRRGVLGEEHPDTLTSMNNLASTLWKQGDYLAARALQEKELEICLRVRGEEHPKTLITMNNLAQTVREQGDYAAARALQETVLEIRRQVLGEEHPDTLTSMNNLALTLRAQGELATARTLQETVLEMSSRVLGEEHPDTLNSMSSLAFTLFMQGDPLSAHALEKKVLEISRRVLGEEHPDTLISRDILAMLLPEQS
ncbi:tetratricopeptide repeat protein [Nitrosospira multiformis]|uniref:Tetratricopeptide repeat protein n=2 Tax=Nitrosospira multiformis TaxID=1231 RepID=A0A2T5I6Z0_9PROT|nr:tetratricopeptide repeat protein [Nitrosospira multiformis]